MWIIDDKTRHLSPDESGNTVDNDYGAGGFNSGLPHYEPVWLAWMKLCFCSVYIAFGILILWRLFKIRDVLEIRARSAYLVLLLGACLLLRMAVYIHAECINLFDAQITLFATHLFFFFITFTMESCYISRVIRLGVAFNPRLKRAIPWIMSEKLLVIASLCVGVAAMAIPIYHFRNTAGAHHDLSFIVAEEDAVWQSMAAITCLEMALLPMVWMVDDIFKISWELVVIFLVGLIDAAGTKLSERGVMSHGVEVIFNSTNFGILSTALLFGLSVVDPVRRMTFNPIAQPAYKTRRIHSKKSSRHHSRITDDASVITAATRSFDDDFQAESMPSSASTTSSRHKWSYDKMAAVPAVAQAFRAFAWRALCQESVMFLEEVARYESGNYAISHPVNSQFSAFNMIVNRFIADGSADEINISARDKQSLMGIYTAGASVFFSLSEAEKRTIFQGVYTEIRSMLEVNLLHRFIDTEGFRKVQLETPTRALHSAGEGNIPRVSTDVEIHHNCANDEDAV